MAAKNASQDTTDESKNNGDLSENFRSGAKLSGELVDSFNEIRRCSDHRDSGDEFSVRNDSLTGATFSKVTEKAARHGFRIRSVLDDGRLLVFERMEHDPNDPRNY